MNNNNLNNEEVYSYIKQHIIQQKLGKPAFRFDKRLILTSALVLTLLPTGTYPGNKNRNQSGHPCEITHKTKIKS